MILHSNHAWISRHFFPKDRDAVQSHFILHIADKKDFEELMEQFYALIKEFTAEVGGSAKIPGIIEKDRFLIEGPKGFSIIEVAPAYTQEEYDELTGNEVEHLDLSVWESMFTQELPEEEDERRVEETNK